MCRTRSRRRQHEANATPTRHHGDDAAYPDAVSDQGSEAAHLSTPTGKPRARSVGLKYRGIPGPHNVITDVPGVEVGYRPLIEGEHVRTGVTAIHPRGQANPGDPVAAGCFSLNGNGELTGMSWIEESGTCQGPGTITNTHAVGIAHAGVVAWMNSDHPELTDVGHDVVASDVITLPRQRDAEWTTTGILDRRGSP